MHSLEHQLNISASPDVVYRALSTAEGLSGWFTTDVSGSGDFLGVSFRHELVGVGRYRHSITAGIQDRLFDIGCIGIERNDAMLLGDLEPRRDTVDADNRVCAVEMEELRHQLPHNAHAKNGH